MNKKILFRLISITVLSSFLGCVYSAPDAMNEKIPKTNSTPIEFVKSISASTATFKPVENTDLEITALSQPILLIQTDFDEYQYLNPETQDSIPFQSSISDSHFRLRENLSPSGKQMYIQIDSTSAIIIDLKTGFTLNTFDFTEIDLFNPEQALVEVEPLLSELDLNPVGLIDAIREAHLRSRNIFSWYQSDRYHIAVQDSGETSTSLFLFDHQTGTQTQLENLPGLVETISPSPNGEILLLKKGLVFLPGVYYDKDFYLINVTNKTNQPLFLSADIKNPSLTWLTEETVSLVHEASMDGGTGLSLINVNRLEVTKITSEPFSDLRRLGDHLLFIKREVKPKTTTFVLYTHNGDILARNDVEKHCFYQFSASNGVLVQCNMDSYFLDKELNLEPFFDSILILSSAPNGSAFVMVNRSGKVFLLDANLKMKSELKPEEAPLEVLWHPASTGFLYRTHGGLYYYKLENQESYLLSQSNLFSDYFNLNAVWINLD